MSTSITLKEVKELLQTPLIFTVGKHTLCKLSFVYTSYIRYGVRAVSKFEKHASLFSYHKDKKICIGHHMQRNIIVF